MDKKGNHPMVVEVNVILIERREPLKKSKKSLYYTAKSEPPIGTTGQSKAFSF
jgi:hypothetical protein